MPAGSTRIKVCGITRVSDAVAAAACGVDAIGLVFHPPSPRAVDVQQAATIVRALPPLLTVVALFVDAPVATVEEVLEQVPVGLLQFHGDESPAYCEGFGRPYLKALRMRPGLDIAAAVEPWAGTAGVLLDSYRPGVPGGTGEAFDWGRVPAALSRPVVLAGGLGPGNVGEAIARLRPAAVDVSGGVESSPGIKDPQQLARFVAAVLQADRDNQRHSGSKP